MGVLKATKWKCVKHKYWSLLRTRQQHPGDWGWQFGGNWRRSSQPCTQPRASLPVRDFPLRTLVVSRNCGDVKKPTSLSQGESSWKKKRRRQEALCLGRTCNETKRMKHWGHLRLDVRARMRTVVQGGPAPIDLYPFTPGIWGTRELHMCLFRSGCQKGPALLFNVLLTPSWNFS